MEHRGENENNSLQEDSVNDPVDQVKKLAGKNRAAALGLAVFLALSTSLTGCGVHNEEEEEDDSYYYGGGGGGGYYYRGGGSFIHGSWSKPTTSTGGKIGYSSPRGGSIGG